MKATIPSVRACDGFSWNEERYDDRCLDLAPGIMGGILIFYMVEIFGISMEMALRT
jgi:hypothetical protein